MSVKRLALAAFVFALFSAKAFAQTPDLEGRPLLALGQHITKQLVVADVQLSNDYHTAFRAPRRPAGLVPLYAAQVVLQAVDVVTTVRGLEAGHREANPMFKSGNSAAMIGAKVAVGSLNIFAAEKLWKKNPKAAMALIVASNVLMSGVVANNVGVLRR